MENSFRRPLVEAHHIRVTLSGQEVLKDISLTLFRGEHVLIRGGNGAGKSTLLRVLRGEQWLDQIQSATGVRQAGRLVWHTGTGPEESPLAGRALSGLVSASQQEKAVRQGWNITGEELVLGGLSDSVYLQQRPDPDVRERIHATVQLLGGEKFLYRFVPTLSQGQLRLLLIARALIRKPALLLLDEVTDGLDRQARMTLLEALERACTLSTLVMTTHRPETLPFWIRKEVFLEHGTLVAPGPVFEQKFPSAPSQPEGCLALRGYGAGIHLQKATVYLDRVPILHELDWTVRPGENWAVLGRNGAGKSTLLRLLAGDEMVAYGGEIQHELPRQGGLVRCLADLRRGIHLVSDLQQATYGYDVSGEELVFSGIDNSVGTYREASEAERGQVAGLMDWLELTPLAKRSIRQCSTGQLRRLLLARALAGEPDLLLLDEPFSGLDAVSRKAFIEVLAQLAKQGIQMILVTHHESDIFSSITHVMQLEEGRIKGLWERKQVGFPQ